MIKITSILMLALVGCLNGQVVTLPKPPVVVTPPVLNEYKDIFDTVSITTAPYVITTSRPIKVGTVVWIYVRGTSQTVIDSVKKTSDPLTVILDPAQIGAGIQLVVVYKSEQ